ncbi:MAG: F0F1 ATP synthase subunit B [Oscillospiraceae bacterium]|nr:F0F1 ATP synthase subunit B [Oscillospiraceae bacterium]
MDQFEAFLGVNPWTALFTLLNFLLVLYVGKRYLYGPVMKMIQDRQKEIDDMYAKADEAKSDAAKLRDTYQQQLSQAQSESDRIVRKATLRAQNREEEILRKASAEADAIRDKAIADIAQEKKKAVNDAKNEISGLAMAIAGKVVERELTDDDQSALIDRFIQDLGDPS